MKNRFGRETFHSLYEYKIFHQFTDLSNAKKHKKYIELIPKLRIDNLNSHLLNDLSFSQP